MNAIDVVLHNARALQAACRDLDKHFICSAALTLEQVQALYAARVYEDCDQNNRAACKRLGVSYHTLRRYLRVAQGLK